MVLKVCDSANEKYGDFSTSNVKNMDHIFKIDNVQNTCIVQMESFTFHIDRKEFIIKRNASITKYVWMKMLNLYHHSSIQQICHCI